jgi:fumarate hydratase class II
MSGEFRIEKDSMGELRVPADALWGAQTQRAVQNFPISGLRMPRVFIRALGLVKEAAAIANLELGLMKEARATAIIDAARAVSSGKADAHFPVDVFQTGSGTSSNMNANEVIARLANAGNDLAIHPNDDVNRGQSSNDVIPTAIQVAAAVTATEQLIPSLLHLASTLDIKAE